MPSTGLSLFILGLVVACVSTVEQSSTPTSNVTTPNANGTNATSQTPISTSTSQTPLYTATIITPNDTTGNSATSPPATMQTGGGSANDTESTPVTKTPTARPVEKTKTTTNKANKKETTTRAKMDVAAPIDTVGIIILVVILVIVLVFGVACFIRRNKRRRYSVDFNSRPDEANIPLSTMEAESQFSAAPVNGLQTFESPEPKKESQEPEAKEEQKAEAEESHVAPGAAESAAPAPTPESPGDAVEQSPPAAAEPSEEEKSDEGDVSNKTSVESLKEANENNSNNADFNPNRDMMSINFWDVPLNSPL